MSFPNPDNYARDCDCGTAGANTTPPPATIQGEIDSLDTRVTVLEETNDVIVSSGGIANLTTAQQALIREGSIVVTTDGKRWVYSGAGSKVLEASYIQLADITPVSPLIFENGGTITMTDNDGVGGAINLSGGVDTGSGAGSGGTINLSGDLGNGGSIDLRGGAGGETGGSIISTCSDGLGGICGTLNMSAVGTQNGGSISTYGSIFGAGGSIDTSDVGGSIDTHGYGGSINTSLTGGSINTSGAASGGASAGGSINTSSGVNGVGGSINTSDGGGSINTSGTSGAGGSINISGFDGGAGGSITSIGGSGGGGGAINTSGGEAGAGGAINTSAGTDGGGGSINTSDVGGSINTSDGGGSINTSGNNGGSINTSGYQSGIPLHAGGSINTSGGANGVGGAINTSDGGGSINTQGVGSIEFGISNTRTILNGSATTDQTITLPDATGTLPIALISASTALNFGSIGGSGDFADLTITLSGAVTTDVVFVTCISGGRGATDGKLIFEAFVSATDTVTVRAHNPTSGSIDPLSYNFKVAIIKTA